jgi:acyl carrier protein
VLAIVSEKTGYPVDMLEPDLDLEADLGIDTVKQAETFLALREAFDIPRREDLKLRDYPTLAHVIGFVKEMRPDLMIDVHRDGIPDNSQYKVEINGQEVSKVRLVVGRGNQNRDANKDLALRIKKVADEKYPGYVKDIYMGKGSYNQDIMPRAILLEVGTHTTDKKDVMVSMDYMSEVISGVLGAQPQAQPNQANQAPAQQSQRQRRVRARKDHDMQPGRRVVN